MNKKVKYVLGVAIISFVTVVIYDIARNKIKASKTAAPATTTTA